MVGVWSRSSLILILKLFDKRIAHRIDGAVALLIGASMFLNDRS